MHLNIHIQLNRKMGIYLMGTYKQFIHFQHLIENFQNPKRLPNLILRKVELLLEISHQCFPVLSNQFLALTNTIAHVQLYCKFKFLSLAWSVFLSALLHVIQS
jgi:hypothetical protein